MIPVLVVEDDRTVAMIHRRVVERIPGFAVIDTVGTGQEAIDSALSGEPQLVVLDLYLPDISGLEVLRRIRGAGLGTDVIVISAAREAETVREALRAGAIDYLLKPFRVERLVESLEEYRQHLEELEGTSHMSQEEIDQLLGRPGSGRSVNTPGATPVPKGIDPNTLQHILQTLAAGGTSLTGDEVAEQTGVSRSTAHRYLRYLTAAGQVRAEPIYGSVGRPELLYRLETA